ncbi:MAG: hypothetical protein DRQ55_11205 [Planctomycetota bacterium]|nr:MAG: hypothetical protein DRQ55_11205 [Planctomycetota bacterium]
MGSKRSSSPKPEDAAAPEGETLCKRVAPNFTRREAQAWTQLARDLGFAADAQLARVVLLEFMANRQLQERKAARRVAARR